jgi:cytidylate kinase
MLFGSGNDLYMEFACMSFRIYLLLVIFNGVQIPAGIFFQSIGKSGKSVLISLSRQVLFLIPSMVIFGYLFKIDGILYSGPFADLLAFILSVVLIIHEFKIMSKPIISEFSQEQINLHKFDKKIIITISREYGSGGRYIGKLVANELGIKLYDKDIITELSRRTGLSTEYIKNHEQRMSLVDNFNNGYYMNNNDELFICESNLIKELANDSCVIVGRCADYILKGKKNVFRVFIYSDMKSKAKRVVKYYHIDKDKALKEINKVNRLRSNHYKHYTGCDWGSKENYDLCINSDSIGVDAAVSLICNMVR